MITSAIKLIRPQIFLFFLFSVPVFGQNEYAIKQKIQESLEEFMNMLSYVNDEEEVITPSMIATRYSGGNYFRFNAKEMKLQNFIEDYCYSDLKRQVVNHSLSISPNNITKVSNNPSDRRWTVNGILKRGYATNKRDNISDESIKFIILWRGVNEEIGLLELDFHSVLRMSVSNVTSQFKDVSRTNTQSDDSEYNNKAYNIGDDAKDLVGESGFKIAYLDNSGKHGFAIKRCGYTKRASTFSSPTIDELKLMYRNRYVLELSTKECWSSTHEEGSKHCHTGFFAALKNKDYCKYYTFDFSKGKTNKRKINSDYSYWEYSILRF